MFEFLKKKPTGTTLAKDAVTEPAAAPVRSGWSPEELASAFDQVQEEKAARQAAEKAQAPKDQTSDAALTGSLAVKASGLM